MRDDLSSWEEFVGCVALPTLLFIGFWFIPAAAAGSVFFEYCWPLALTTYGLAYILISGPIIYLLGLWFKAVEMDDEWLYISNFRRAIRVPLSDVCAVEEWWLGIRGGHPIRISFVRPTAFGKRIVFLAHQPSFPYWPPSEWFKRRDHPVVKRLRAAVVRARWLAAADAHTPEITGGSPGVKAPPKASACGSSRTDISSQGPGDIRKEDGKRG